MSSESELPDIIFLDINMPYMDGWDFMEHFIDIKPNLPKEITIYMVSSSVQAEDMERAKALEDFSNYIIKPIDEKRFKEILAA